VLREDNGELYDQLKVDRSRVVEVLDALLGLRPGTENIPRHAGAAAGVLVGGCFGNEIAPLRELLQPWMQRYESMREDDPDRKEVSSFLSNAEHVAGKSLTKPIIDDVYSRVELISRLTS